MSSKAPLRTSSIGPPPLAEYPQKLRSRISPEPSDRRGLPDLFDDSAVRECDESRGTRYSERHSAQNDARARGGEGHSSRSVAGFPDIGQDELVRFFTLTPADVEFVASCRGRGPAQGLGLAVQLCTLPWLGFVPDEVRAAPQGEVARLGARLKVDPGVLACYGAREQTRTDHLLAVTDYLGWKSAPAAGAAAKELEEFVACRAMEHDSPSLLCRRAPVHVASSLGGSGRD